VSDQQIHSKIGASGMHRWGSCPGQIRLAENLPTAPSSDAADEGTLAHEVSELTNNNKPIPDRIREHRLFSEEMIDHADEFNRIIHDDINGGEPGANIGAKLFVEEKFHLKEIDPDAFGTSDDVVWKPGEKLLYVYDYKYGIGIVVEVEYNWQVLYYGLGVLLKHKFPAEQVELVIHQPRAPHKDGITRRWRIPTIDILNFAMVLTEKIEATKKPNAPLKSGSWCRFCPAAAVCPEAAKKANEMAKTVFDNQVVEVIDFKKLSIYMKMFPAIKAWMKEVESWAKREADEGRIVPGQKLVPKRGRRQFKVNRDGLTFLETVCGFTQDEMFTTRELISFKKAEDLLKKKKII